MRDHIIPVLTWGQIVRSCDDFLDNWGVNLGTRKFLKHALYDATSSFVFAQFKHLSLDDRNKKLNFLERHVDYHALNHIVPFFAVHHLDDHFLVKLGKNLFFLLN